jgi:hypothetical protein
VLTVLTLEMKLIDMRIDSSHVLCLGGATGASPPPRVPAHRLDEVQPIREALHRIAVFVSQFENDVPAAWIRPIYRPGQFEPQGPMADICLAGSSDLDFDPLLTPTGS